MQARRLAVAVAAAAAAPLALAGPAAARTDTSLTVFRSLPAVAGYFVASGQLQSSKASCASGRAFKLVRRQRGGSKVLDSGRASADGAIGAFSYPVKVNGNAKLTLKTPRTKACAAAQGRVPIPAPGRVRARRATVNTVPGIAGIASKGNQGALVGLILLDARAKCFADRKTTLESSTGKVLDTGVTSKTGAWALHLTASEYASGSPVTFTVKGTHEPFGDRCAAATESWPGTEMR